MHWRWEGKGEGWIQSISVPRSAELTLHLELEGGGKVCECQQ